MHLRRYLLKQKQLIPKEGNLILTNEILTNLGLKSLQAIKEGFNKDSERKIKGFNEIGTKTGKTKKTLDDLYPKKQTLLCPLFTVQIILRIFTSINQ